MHDDLKARLDATEASLDPEVARSRLILASLFIATFEALKGAIIEPPLAFFANRYTASGPEQSEEYKRVVLARHRSKVTATLMFLRDEVHAVTEDDLKAYDRIRSCRNEVAHELLKIAWNRGLPSGFTERFTEMVDLMRKVDRWWFENVEMATNEDIPRDTDPSAVLSGADFVLQVITKVALAPEPESRDLLEAFRRERRKRAIP
jgi:hypothetical protein